MSCYRRVAGGIVVAVRVTPNARRDSSDGVKPMADGRAALHLRLNAVPEKGAANEALRRFVAALFTLPKSAVTIERGSQSRLKHVRVSGAAEALAAIADRWPVWRDSADG